MRSLLVFALSALSVVSGQSLLTMTAPPGTPCPYSTTSVTMTEGSLNRFKYDYSGNAPYQLSSCDVALRCPDSSTLMNLFVSRSTPTLGRSLNVNVNSSRTSGSAGTTVAISNMMAIPLTAGEGVGINIWGDSGYVNVQATCHAVPGGGPTANSQVNYLAPSIGGTSGAATIPAGSATAFSRRYTDNTKQAYILTCSATNYGDLNSGTPVVQLDSITGNVGTDDSMAVIAADSNIGRVYTKDGAATFATAASTNRSSFEVSSAFAIVWTAGATAGQEAGFTISYTCRNATGFTTSGAGAAMVNTGSGAAAAFSATVAAVVAVAACLLA